MSFAGAVAYILADILTMGLIVIIKRCTLADHAGWLGLRLALWPDCGSDSERDKQLLLSAPERFLVLTINDVAGSALGFAEASIRNDYVNGTRTSPVAFLEGLYVLPAHRHQSLARQLVAAVQLWSRERGCSELASDAPLDNHNSHAMHQGLGFTETERVVYFCKSID